VGGSEGWGVRQQDRGYQGRVFQLPMQRVNPQRFDPSTASHSRSSPSPKCLSGGSGARAAAVSCRWS